MSVIKVMSENLANKIAAGEVIEKCSSIVKELVENSIDAKSKNIKINLLKGGLEEVTVIDDGVGMDELDAEMAFLRHATSKIYKDDDLFFIDTLGFRGEALPSISSVSEVVLETCKEEVGTLIHIKGGKVLEKSHASARIGTKITITNLFYNTPARLKYLKSEPSELASITALVEKIALARPEIAFTLTNNDKELVRTSGSNNLLKAIHEIYGMQVSSKMLEINVLNDDFEVKGYICKPEVLKSTKNHMITFINGRLVKNYDIFKAINDAYYTYKPDIKYPVVVLNIYADPTLIDVNIHPTKQDVKISKKDDLYGLLYENIKKILYDNLLIPDALRNEKREEIKDAFVPIDNYESFTGNQTVFSFEENTIKDDHDNIEQELKNLYIRPIGIALNTYILCEMEDGICMIDQHAAQERINYELFLDNLKKEEIHTTTLLIPINIELSSSEYTRFLEIAKIFEGYGFKWEEFGINTIIVKEHPTWLINGEEEESVRQIIDLLLKSEADFDPVKFREHIAITLACKKAIKAHDHISMMQVEELINNLVKCNNPYNCPHGRPTLIKFNTYDLEKMFKRVMN